MPSPPSARCDPLLANASGDDKPSPAPKTPTRSDLSWRTCAAASPAGADSEPSTCPPGLRPTNAPPRGAAPSTGEAAFRARVAHYLLLTATLLSKRSELPPPAYLRPGSESRCFLRPYGKSSSMIHSDTNTRRSRSRSNGLTKCVAQGALWFPARVEANRSPPNEDT